MSRFVLTLTGVALLALPFRSTAAQDRPMLPPQFFSDSTLWQRVLAHVVQSLSTYQVRTGVDTNPQPWQISLAYDGPQREMLMRQLRTILRARPHAASDTMSFSLHIGPLTIVADTARVSVRTSFDKRCRDGRMGGFGNEETVIVPRHPRVGWGVASSQGMTHGARAACAGPW